MSAEARWTGFLDKLTGRHAQILEEARDGCLGLLEACDGDIGPMSQGWTAMNVRALQLESKITNTWSEKVEGVADDVVHAHEDRGHALERALERQRELCRIGLYADAARHIWTRALEEQVSAFGCTQCAGPIEVPPTMRSINLTCPSCSAVTTFEPGQRVRSIAHTCIHPLCEAATLAQSDAVAAAQEAVHANETPQTVDALIGAYRVYWTAYLELRASMSGDPLDLEKELTGRLRSVREQYGTE